MHERSEVSTSEWLGGSLARSYSQGIGLMTIICFFEQFVLPFLFRYDMPYTCNVFHLVMPHVMRL